MTNSNWKQRNKMDIDKYLDYKKITNKARTDKISPKSLELYKKNLTYLSNDLKKLFKDAIEEDILKHLKKTKSTRYKNSKIFTFQDFFRYIYKLDKDDKLPECIRRIKKTRVITNDEEYRERIITDTEYNQLITFAHTPMEKAWLEFLRLTGCRKQSIEKARATDVTFDGEFTRIYIRDDKTGNRDFSYPKRMNHLLDWVENYQSYKGQKGKPLFITTYNSKTPVKISTSYISDTLKRIGKRAGLRHITPHDFRHTRTTELLGQDDKIKETHVKTLLGFSKDTEMFKIYDHNKISDYEKFIKTKNREIKPTYKQQEKKIKILEEKHEEEIKDLTKQVNSLWEIIRQYRANYP
jgi:integrase